MADDRPGGGFSQRRFSRERFTGGENPHATTDETPHEIAGETAETPGTAGSGQGDAGEHEAPGSPPYERPAPDTAPAPPATEPAGGHPSPPSAAPDFAESAFGERTFAESVSDETAAVGGHEQAGDGADGGTVDGGTADGAHDGAHDLAGSAVAGFGAAAARAVVAGADRVSLRRPGAPLLIGVALVLLLGIGGGAWVLNASSESCKAAPLRITVAADPDIAPAVREIAARFNVQTNEVNGRCVRADVIDPESVLVARSLAGQTFGGAPVSLDGWIPASSFWITLARAAGARTVPDGGVPLASSPVVMAVTRPVAEELRAAGDGTTWRLAATGRAGDLTFSRRVLRPSAGMPGVVSMVALDQLAAEGRAAGSVRGFVRQLQDGTAADDDAMFSDLTSLVRADRGMMITTEQAVVAYNAAHRPNPADPLVPAEGTVPVDYPFAVIARDSARKDAAEAFQFALGSRLARDTFQKHGFRAPDGTMTDGYARRNGLPAAAPKPLALPTQKQILTATADWTADVRGTRTLILADVSRSMGEKAVREVPQSTRALLGARAGTRLGLVLDALLKGLPLFPSNADLGLWTFGTGAGGVRPYKEIVPLGPVDQRTAGRTRREQLARALPGLRPRPRGDTGLYDALPAAYRQLRSGPDGGKASTLLVLTDGDDEGDLIRGALGDLVRKDKDRGNPIRIDVVAFGPDVDAAGLRALTDLTGGGLHLTEVPANFGALFAEAVSPRLCLLTCTDS